MNDRFLNSSVPQSFEALGHAGSDHYVGLELFPNPGCHSVIYSSDEVTANCPITGQPDFYKMELILMGTERLIESKSLKLWLRGLSDGGIFCEGLAVHIRDMVGESLELDEEDTAKMIQCTLVQKSRGGISIKAVA